MFLQSKSEKKNQNTDHENTQRGEISKDKHRWKESEYK